MPRKQKPARLWPIKKRGQHFILDNIDEKRVQISTGCGLGETEKAERALAEYTIKVRSASKGCTNARAPSCRTA